MELKEADIKKYMERCITLAKMIPLNIRKPYVGALVLSKDGELVGEGSKNFLDNTSLIIHAERMALDNAGNFADGGYLLTTLEPCTGDDRVHIFKPCCELIVERGIHTVVVALIDSLPSANGRGIKYLRDRGVDVMEYSGLDYVIKQELMDHHRRIPQTRVTDS